MNEIMNNPTDESVLESLSDHDALKIRYVDDLRGLPPCPKVFCGIGTFADMDGLDRLCIVLAWTDEYRFHRKASFYYEKDKGWVYNGEEC